MTAKPLHPMKDSAAYAAGVADSAPSHTPGPWEWANDQVFSLAEPPNYNDSICTVLQKAPHWEANAALIASAPALLEAMRDAEYAIGNLAASDAPDLDGLLLWAEQLFLPAARAAIARAERRPEPMP